MGDGVAPIAPPAAAMVIHSVQPPGANHSDNGKDRNVLLGSLSILFINTHLVLWQSTWFWLLFRWRAYKCLWFHKIVSDEAVMLMLMPMPLAACLWCNTASWRFGDGQPKTTFLQWFICSIKSQLMWYLFWRHLFAEVFDFQATFLFLCFDEMLAICSSSAGYGWLIIFFCAIALEESFSRSNSVMYRFCNAVDSGF